jgi:AcrR family transcriptional regulator
MTQEAVERAGLRERKKAKARRDLGVAALQLAVERGIENVNVQEIADRADVSPRTFSNYFANKQEAVCGLAADRAARIGEALVLRPPDESLAAAVRGAILEEYQPDRQFGAERMRSLVNLTSSPAIRGAYLRTRETMRVSLAEGLAARAGSDLDEIAVNIAAGAIVVAVDVAIDSWIRSQEECALAPLIEKALGHVLPILTDATRRRPQ